MADPNRSALRRQVEDASSPLLARLHGLPRPLVPIVTLALVAVGVLAPTPVAWLALGVVLVFICWIGYLSWPAVRLSGRLLRIAMVGLLVTVAVTRL